MRKLLYIVLLSLLLPLSSLSQQAAPDFILLNGKVFSADPAKPFAEAVAIRGERILAVGTSSEVEKLAGAKTRRIDLHGRVVVPGFNDAHYHFSPDPKGFTLQFKTMEPNWGETSQAIAAAAKQNPLGTWILGYIGSEVILNDQVTRFALDKLAPQHPVLLRTYYGHGYVANSKAMPLLRIGEEERDPAGGRFERLAGSKRVNGRFWAYAQFMPNRILGDRISDEDNIKELRKMANEAVGFGITSMQIMPRMSVDSFIRLLIRADLPIRVRAIPFSQTNAKGRDLSEIRQLSKLKSPNLKITASGIKWILDGTPFEHGAALRQGYNDKPDSRGKLLFNQNEIEAMVKESLDFNQQILFHCAGDRCAEAVMDAMGKVGGGKIDWKTKRVRIEHGDGLSSDLIQRAKKLGVIVVQNPTHFSLVDIIHARYSASTKFFSVRSLLEADVPFALGSDGPMNPFLNLMLATIHPTNPSEAITREQAIKAYSYGSAFAEFGENDKGTITQGKLADLAVLSQDVFSVPVPELPKISSVLTIVGGRIVYDAQGLK